MQSDVKTSVISDDGMYIISKATSGIHNLYVKYVDSNDNAQVVGEKTVTIIKGDNSSVPSDVVNIALSSSQQTAIVNIKIN